MEAKPVNRDLDRLRKVGLSVSSSSSQSDEVQLRLSELEVSESGRPKPANSVPILPPGVSVNGAGQRRNLLSGISVSGGSRYVKNLLTGVSPSGGLSPAKLQTPFTRPPLNILAGIRLSGGPSPVKP